MCIRDSYSRATVISDAKRHGLRVRPVCVIASAAATRVEDDTTIRLGLGQVKGLSSTAIRQILAVPKNSLTLEAFLLATQLTKSERRILAKIGALNSLENAHHRRAALWSAEQTLVQGDLFQQHPATQAPPPLKPMRPFERIAADYDGLGLSTGGHPMALLREKLPHAWRAIDLSQGRHHQHLIIAGAVICRQRPGTAKGHVFISLEDETGVANAFVPSATFEAYRLTIVTERFLQITGRLQVSEGGVRSLYALKIEKLPVGETASTPAGASHDFH